MVNSLPKGFSVRPPIMDDLEAVADLIKTCEIAEQSEPDYPVEELRADWLNSQVNLERDAWLVTGPGQQIVGYALIFNVEDIQLFVNGWVHPHYQGRGIGTYLVRMGERRARQQAASAPAGVRVSLYNSVNSLNQAARRILEGEGYGLVRHFWRMQIDMDEAPPAPQWPDGIRVRAFAPGQDECATFEAFQEAFQDNWGYIPWRFETWQQMMIQRENFDPTLWFLALDGDKIVGGSLCFDYAREGWVDDLAVRRAWRRQGVGLALLRHSFGELYRRAQRRVALGVDTQNTSGATRLYDRAGMHVSRQYDIYYKELRPGSDPG